MKKFLLRVENLYFRLRANEAGNECFLLVPGIATSLAEAAAQLVEWCINPDELAAAAAIAAAWELDEFEEEQVDMASSMLVFMRIDETGDGQQCDSNEVRHDEMVDDDALLLSCTAML